MLFTFPSRYWFAIDHKMYLALPDSPGKFRWNFTCSILLRKVPVENTNFVYEAITRSGWAFHPILLLKIVYLLSHRTSYYP